MTERFQRSMPLPFNYNTLQRMPTDCTGVYVFWSESKSKAIYVGETSRPIRKRLLEHFHQSHNFTLRTWIRRWQRDLRVCYVSVPEKHARKLEKRLIRLLDPQANDEGIQRPATALRERP